MTHTEGASPQPEPARRWTWIPDVENDKAFTPLVGLLPPDSPSHHAFFWMLRSAVRETDRDQLLATLNAAEDSQRELGLHKLNDKGQCPICYDAGYEDGREVLRAELEIWTEAFSQDKPFIQDVLEDAVLGEHVGQAVAAKLLVLMEDRESLRAEVRDTEDEYDDLLEKHDQLRGELAEAREALTAVQLERDAAVSACEVLRRELAEHQFVEWQATVDRDRALAEAESLRAMVERLLSCVPGSHQNDGLLRRRLTVPDTELAVGCINAILAARALLGGRGETDGGES